MHRFALLLLLAACGSPYGATDVEPEEGTATAESAAAAASAAQCHFLAISPQVSAFPAQTDPHATYAVASVALDPSAPVRFEIEGEYAKANYSRFTVYDAAGQVVDERADAELLPAPGSFDPYVDGAFVLDPRRSYSAVVAPAGDSMSTPNRLALPSGKSAFVVLRIYSPIGTYDPQTALPKMRAIDVKTNQPVRCASLAIPMLDQAGLDFPPVDANGDVGFYRIPPQLFGNGTNGYLMASLDPTRVAVIQIPQLPTYFDEKAVVPKTRFVTPDVRYVSLGSYGQSPNTNHVIEGAEAKKDGAGAYFVVADESLRARIEAAGLNFLPLSQPKRLGIAPYLVYRNSVTRPGFAGLFSNVALPPGAVSQATPSLRADQFIGDYAPRGKQCSADELFTTGCGYETVAAKLRL